MPSLPVPPYAAPGRCEGSVYIRGSGTPLNPGRHERCQRPPTHWSSTKYAWLCDQHDRGAKRVLRSHITNEHHRRPSASMTFAELGAWHSEQHHRFGQSHTHAGTNAGPDQRPPGWKTGEDMILRGRR